MNIIHTLRFAILFLLLAIAACSETAHTSDTTTLASFTKAPIPGDDAPELAHLGDYRIGVRTLKFSYEGNPDVSLLGYGTGYAPEVTRQITVDLIYPAMVDPGIAGDAVYRGLYQTGLTDVEGLPEQFEVHGIAVRDAEPVTEARFPLVLFSHGFFTTPGVMSGITENLASKGYVVASIDHYDEGNESDTPIHRFARSVLSRSIDQQRIYAEMVALSNDPQSPIGRMIDPESTALIGFSMGAFGVLHHAGAGFDADGDAFALIPDVLMADQLETDAAFIEKNRDHIKAAVVLAPWGGVAGQAWTDSALGNIKSPLLILAGDEDDVSRFDDGIVRLFNQASGADRYLMVFQNARHNIAQVPAPPSAHLDVVPWQTFEEPVWRRERILSIGNHFITAFLDLHLKGDASKLAYLDVSPTHANDATWEQPFAVDYSDHYADGSDGSETYWRGFKRRQALGMEMHKLERGESK